MGTYIRTVVEIHTEEGWSISNALVFTNDKMWSSNGTGPFICVPFSSQNYDVYALFSGIRDRHGIRPIADPRGLPDDASYSSVSRLAGPLDFSPWDDKEECDMTVAERVSQRVDKDRGCFSWLGTEELLAVDYEQLVESDPSGSSTQTLKMALGERYFEHLNQLKTLSGGQRSRVLFCFS